MVYGGLLQTPDDKGIETRPVKSTYGKIVS